MCDAYTRAMYRAYLHFKLVLRKLLPLHTYTWFLRKLHFVPVSQHHHQWYSGLSLQLFDLLYLDLAVQYWIPSSSSEQC